MKMGPQDPDNFAVAALDTATLGGVTITTPTAGKGHVLVPAAATRSFPDGDVECVYDIKMLTSAGEQVTIQFGTITVHPTATRAIA